MSEETLIQQPVAPTYTAEFTTIITGIRTGTVGDLVGVVKKVEFTVRGTLQGQTFELPQSCDLTEPESASFAPLDQLTEPLVVTWVEENFDNWNGVKSHIQYVLDREVSKAALESAPLPWAPAPEPTPEPATEPAAE